MRDEMTESKFDLKTFDSNTMLNNLKITKEIQPLHKTVTSTASKQLEENERQMRSTLMNLHTRL